MKAVQINNTKSFSEKIFAWLLCFALIFQGMVPAYASIPSSTVEAYLDNEPGIVPDTFEPYKPNEALRSKAPNATSITTFYELLQTSAPAAITSTLGKKIGDEVVQARLIRTQLQILIGRSLLDKVENPLPIQYASEASQLQGLYQNAFNLLSSELSGRTFGQNLGINPVDSGLSQPIVWPEYRTIRGMTSVLVPVLYLPKHYYDTLNVTTNLFESAGYITLSNLIIENAVIRLGQQTYIDVTNDLINNGGTIRGEADLAITAGKAFKNLGGSITSYDDLRIGAHSFENQTLLYQFDTEVGTSTVYGQIAGLGSDTGDVIVRSYSDIVFEGSQAEAPNGNITLTANGDIRLDSGEIVKVESERYGSGTKTTSAVTHLASTLSAKDTIELIAGGRILIEGANIHSDQGHIKLLSALGITILDETGVTQSQASGKFGKREVTESVYQTVAIRSILDAGKGVKLHTDLGDITLRAVDITSTEGTTVNAQNGTVNLLTTVETDHYAYSSVKEGLFTTKTKNTGRNIETGVPNTIVGGFAVEAASAIHVEYTGNPDLTLDEQIAELAKMPGMEWMATVRGDSVTPNVDWSLIELQYDTWNESNTSLSPAFAAVIAIAVAIMTQGSAADFATTIVGAATENAVMHAAVTAGFTSFFSQAALAAGNGLVNGDIVGAMEDFASDDTLKNLAVSMVTAGAIQAVDAEFFEYIAGQKVPLEKVREIEQNLRLSQQVQQALLHATVKAGTNSLILGADFDDSFRASLFDYAADRIGQNMANKIGETFKASEQNPFDKAFQYISHAAAGCVIGVVRGASDSNQAEREDYCKSGAGGALVGEFVGDIYKQSIGYDEKVAALQELKNDIDGFEETAKLITADMTPEQKAAVINFFNTGDYSLLDSLSDDQFFAIADITYDLENFRISQANIQTMSQNGVDVAKLSAAFVALLADGDVDTAAFTGENAAENNALWFIPPLVKGTAALLTAWGVYEVTLNFKDKYDRYADDLSSNDPDVAGAAAEALAWELAEEAEIAVGTGLTVAAAAYAGKELFEQATKWDKLARLVKLLEQTGNVAVKELDEIKALYFKRKDYNPGDGTDNFDKIYFATPEMDADPYHVDWLRFQGPRSVGADVTDYAEVLDSGAWRLIGANSASIDPNKISGYALNLDHPVGKNKAIVFDSALGFNQTNAESLVNQIKEGIKNTTPTPGKVDNYGARFTVDIPVTGPKGSGVVRTGWIYEGDSNTPRLTTLFVK